MSASSLATVLRFDPATALLQGVGVPSNEIIAGKYIVRFARTSEEVDLALRLRFKIFNLELGEGLASSFRTGRDEDTFDSTSHHLLLIDQSRRQVIGTCRVRTYEIAKTIDGFYSSIKFDLSTLLLNVLEQTIEYGRVCIAEPYRNTQALMLLWKGLALYSLQHRKEYFFGCCSLNSQDPTEGGRVFDLLSSQGHLHPEFRVNVRPGSKCLWYKTPEPDRTVVTAPHLWQTHLRLGSKICGPPAMDRQIRTIDFLVAIDVNKLDRRMHCLIFGTPAESHEFARTA